MTRNKDVRRPNKMRFIRLMVAVICCLFLSLAAMGQEGQDQPYSETPTQPTTVIPIDAKREGTIRVGVVPVKAQVKQSDQQQDLGESILDRWYTFLQGPAVEIVPMESRIPIQVRLEASQKGCDYILYSSVTQKGKSNMFGSLFKTAIPVVASTVPIPVSGGVAGTVQSGAVNAAKNIGVQAAGNINIKANDHVTLDYDFVNVASSSSLLARSVKGKAKTDGEDVFSTLIEQASTQFLELALKK
jgi:hypothetical protein